MRLLSYLLAADKMVRFGHRGEIPQSGTTSHQKLRTHGAREVGRKKQGTRRGGEGARICPLRHTAL